MSNETIEKLWYGIAITAMALVISFIGMILISPAHADDEKPIIKTVYVEKIVYVDRAVIHSVTPAPIVKTVYVEVPVYETMTVTNNPKTVRAMMKVTHDRYLALLAKYRELVKVKK